MRTAQCLLDAGVQLTWVRSFHSESPPTILEKAKPPPGSVAVGLTLPPVSFHHVDPGETQPRLAERWRSFHPDSTRSSFPKAPLSRFAQALAPHSSVVEPVLPTSPPAAEWLSRLEAMSVVRHGGMYYDFGTT